jgi:hypothetical protein
MPAIACHDFTFLFPQTLPLHPSSSSFLSPPTTILFFFLLMPYAEIAQLQWPAASFKLLFFGDGKENAPGLGGKEGLGEPQVGILLLMIG